MGTLWSIGASEVGVFTYVDAADVGLHVEHLGGVERQHLQSILLGHAVAEGPGGVEGRLTAQTPRRHPSSRAAGPEERDLHSGGIGKEEASGQRGTLLGPSVVVLIPKDGVR